MTFQIKALPMAPFALFFMPQMRNWTVWARGALPPTTLWAFRAE